MTTIYQLHIKFYKQFWQMLATLLLALPSKHFYLKAGGFIWWRATAAERIHEKNASNAYLSMHTCKQTGLPEHESAERWLGVSSHRFWQTWASSLTAQEIVGCHQWQWATQTHIPADGTAGGKSLVQGQGYTAQGRKIWDFSGDCCGDHICRNPASKHLFGKGKKLSKLFGAA